MLSNMTLEQLAEKYDLSRIKTNASVNGVKLRITDIKRTDGEMLSRKEMITMCDGFLLNFKISTKTVMVM